jgi:large subunit ribosomal protein L25
MDAKLMVKSRDIKGSAHARRMRRTGWVPGVIYNDGGEAREISLPKHDFEQMLHHHASEHVMVQIQIDDGQAVSVLLKDIQRDALSGGVLHVDLQEVAMNKKLRVEVPIELLGEAEGVKQGGVLDHLLHHVEIECLPSDIPEQIDVDVSGLKIGDMLTIQDIQLDSSKYTILMDGEVGVASVSMPRAVEEEEVPAEGEEGAAEGAPAEPEVIREKKVKEEEAE